MPLRSLSHKIFLSQVFYFNQRDSHHDYVYYNNTLLILIVALLQGIGALSTDTSTRNLLGLRIELVHPRVEVDGSLGLCY